MYISKADATLVMAKMQFSKLGEQLDIIFISTIHSSSKISWPYNSMLVLHTHILILTEKILVIYSNISTFVYLGGEQINYLNIAWIYFNTWMFNSLSTWYERMSYGRYFVNFRGRHLVAEN